MNLAIYNFFLFLVWLIVGVGILVIGPYFAPNTFKGNQREIFIGSGALVLSMWNLMRWWMNRSLQKSRQRMEEEYRERAGERAAKDPPPVVNPEFKFDDPPPGANGTGH
jgi:hypothetical protein